MKPKFYAEVFPGEKTYFKHERLHTVQTRADFQKIIGHPRVRAWGNDYDVPIKSIIREPNHISVWWGWVAMIVCSFAWLIAFADWSNVQWFRNYSWTHYIGFEYAGCWIGLLLEIVIIIFIKRFNKKEKKLAVKFNLS